MELAYACCDNHPLAALEHMAGQKQVSIRRIDPPHESYKCHCGVLATFFLVHSRDEAAE